MCRIGHHGACKRRSAMFRSSREILGKILREILAESRWIARQNAIAREPKKTTSLSSNCLWKNFGKIPSEQCTTNFTYCCSERRDFACSPQTRTHLCSNLVSALANLNVHDFPHGYLSCSERSIYFEKMFPRSFINNNEVEQGASTGEQRHCHTAAAAGWSLSLRSSNCVPRAREKCEIAATTMRSTEREPSRCAPRAVQNARILETTCRQNESKRNNAYVCIYACQHT